VAIGETGVGVAEPFGHDLDGGAGGDEERCVGVAQSVEADAWHVEAVDLPVEELVDRFRGAQGTPSRW
jgi:hypothetical protein